MLPLICIVFVALCFVLYRMPLNYYAPYSDNVELKRIAKTLTLLGTGIVALGSLIGFLSKFFR